MANGERIRYPFGQDPNYARKLDRFPHGQDPSTLVPFEKPESRIDTNSNGVPVNDTLGQNALLEPISRNARPVFRIKK